MKNFVHARPNILIIVSDSSFIQPFFVLKHIMIIFNDIRLLGF